MSTIELNATIFNDTQNTLTLVSDDTGDAPQTIPSKLPVPFNFGSDWTNIEGNITYQIDSSHTVNVGWDIQMAGSNAYVCSISPDDGQYGVSRSGDDIHCYHCNETFTVTQSY